MNNYKHLTLEDRIAIQFALGEKKSHRLIARSLGFHHSTISGEIKRNSVTQFKQGKYRLVYIAKTAHNMAISRRKQNASKLTEENLTLLYPELKQHNSFESTVGKIRKTKKDFPSTQTLYNWYHKGLIKLSCAYKRAYKLTKKKQVRVQSKLKSELCYSIHERPNYINAKRRFGDWDLDLMQSSGDGGFMIGLYIACNRFCHY